MRHTEQLTRALKSANECNCIICASCLYNLWRAEQLWRATTVIAIGEKAMPKWEMERREKIAAWHRGLYRVNWKAAAKSLLQLKEQPEMHLKGAPDVTYQA